MTHIVSDVYKNNYLANWQSALTTIRKPIIAAVSGYAVRPRPLSPFIPLTHIG